MRTSNPITNIAVKHIVESYSKGIEYLLRIMSFSGLTWVEPKYDPHGAKCYNMHDATGETDLIVRLDYDRENDTITAIGESGQDYPLGEDYGGQDNYTLAGLENLIVAVNDELQKFHSRGLYPVPNQVQTAVGACKVIAEFIGKDGYFSFEHGYPLPPFRDGEKIVGLTQTRIQTYTPDKRSLTHPLGILLLKELKEIIGEINNYLKYVHNSCR